MRSRRPAIRKELELAEAGLQEAARKRQEAVRAHEMSGERLASDRAKLGLSGALPPRVEVQQLAGALPELFRAASERLGAGMTMDAIAMYRGWSEACLKRMGEENARLASAAEAGAAGGGGKGSARSKAAQAAAASSATELPRAVLLPLLARAHAAGVLPQHGSSSTLLQSTAAGGGGDGGGGAAAAVEIDWGGEGGGGDAGGGEVAEIRWGDEEGAGAAGAAVEIDWGRADAGGADGAAGAAGDEAIEIDWGGDGGAAGGGDGGGGDGQIDWGITAEGAGGSEAIEIDWGGAAEGGGDAADDVAGWIEVEARSELEDAAGGAAGGEGAEALYKDAALRSGLVDDLLEVSAAGLLRCALPDCAAADPLLLLLVLVLLILLLLCCCCQCAAALCAAARPGSLTVSSSPPPRLPFHAPPRTPPAPHSLGRFCGSGCRTIAQQTSKSSPRSPRGPSSRSCRCSAARTRRLACCAPAPLLRWEGPVVRARGLSRAPA